MSRAARILALMADGRQYSNMDLCRMTGLSKRQIDSAIGQLRNAGRLETAPVLHSITAEGTAALTGGRIHATRKPRAVQPVRPMPTTEMALSSRPALQMAWSAGA